MAIRRVRAADPRQEGGVDLGPARISEAAEIAAISRREVEYGLDWRWRRGLVLAHIRDGDSCVVVARDRGRVVGFALMSFRFDDRRAHLVLLAVTASHRRRGIASRLLDWVEVLARRGGIRCIQLEVRETAGPARAFYRRRGFDAKARLPGYYQGREDASRLEKAL
jgi:ribosomal-protein-alanine N-acetyltransferase